MDCLFLVSGETDTYDGDSFKVESLGNGVFNLSVTSADMGAHAEGTIEPGHARELAQFILDRCQHDERVPDEKAESIWVDERDSAGDVVRSRHRHGAVVWKNMECGGRWTYRRVPGTWGWAEVGDTVDEAKAKAEKYISQDSADADEKCRLAPVYAGHMVTASSLRG